MFNIIREYKNNLIEERSPLLVFDLCLFLLADLAHGTMTFQAYYLILLLIAALIFAAFIHCKETWVLGHGLSYLLGFPAMQILLPIYAICNMVDQSWGTRDQVNYTPFVQ